MSGLEDRLDAIDHRRLRLEPNCTDETERGPHRPDFSLWASFEPDEGGALVTLSMSAMWAQPVRFASLSPDEARQLARHLTEIAQAIEAVAGPAPRISAVVEG